MLSWPAGAADCRVVAAAGQFVLLQPLTLMSFTDSLPDGCTLTFLDGMIPMGWDGEVEFGPVPGELRFRLSDSDAGAERRSSVRLPVFAEVIVTSSNGSEMRGSLLDVSAGGMRFRDTGRHELGTILRVHVALPGARPSPPTARSASPRSAASPR